MTKYPIVFTSFSKRNFYLRFQISAFCLLQQTAPVSPFMNFDYNLAGLVDKNHIRIANNTLIEKADELWVFGEVSDGVLIEIYLAKKAKLNVRYFALSEQISEIKEIKESAIQLEDVSEWIWEWVVTGKSLERWHPRLRFKKTYPLVYPAYSKRNFFWQMQISSFCLQKRTIPLNPFMLFRYFLGDLVPRQNVYEANKSLVARCDQLWVFGEISDGVLAEIKQKKEQKKLVTFFKIVAGDPVQFRLIMPKSATFEDLELTAFKAWLL